MQTLNFQKLLKFSESKEGMDLALSVNIKDSLNAKY